MSSSTCPTGSVRLGGVVLAANEVEIQLRALPGTAVAEDDGLVVLVNTEIDGDLRAEGDAREMTRAIQDLRKQAELELDEIIDLWVDAPPAVLAPTCPVPVTCQRGHPGGGVDDGSATRRHRDDDPGSQWRPSDSGLPRPRSNRLTSSGPIRRRWAVFIGLAAIVIVADQLSKMWIDANFALASPHPLPGGEQPTPIIDGLIRIAKSYNTGGIFGMFGNSALLLALASTFVIGLIFVYQWREGTRGTWLLTVALGFLLGGALGNFIDRIRYQHVIDFVDMGIGEWRWYTFNVADSAISIALVLLLLLSVFGDRLARRMSQQAA